MNRSAAATGWVLGILGAVIGGAVGFWAFRWIAGQGFYALMLPGALLGLGFGYLSRRASVAGGIVCGVFGVGFGVFSEWKCFPFNADESFEFFISHLYELSPVTLIMIVFGGVFAFWFGRGRDSESR